MTDRNQGETPSNNPFEGDKEEVRAGLYAALVEAVLAFLSAPSADVKASRKVNGYMKKDAMKANKMAAMARFMSVRPGKVTPAQLLAAGVLQVRGIISAGKPLNPVPVMGQFMARAFEVSSAVRRAAAAIVAFDAWDAADLATRTAAIERSGQEAIEIPEGHTAATAAALDAFGLTVGDYVRHVVIESAAMLRGSFVALREKLNGVPLVNAANIRTLNENGTATHLDASEDAHLMLNIGTVMAWFNSRVFATARYCSTCKRSGEPQFNFGNQQVKTAGNACPQCGTPARMLGRNSNTAHLPFITTAKAGLKVVGGWRVSMTSFIMPKATFNALMKASLGQMPVEDAFAVLMKSRVDVRQQVDGRTVKTKAQLVPVCYETQGQTGGFELHYGLAIEPLHLGDL